MTRGGKDGREVCVAGGWGGGSWGGGRREMRGGGGRRRGNFIKNPDILKEGGSQTVKPTSKVG